MIIEEFETIAKNIRFNLVDYSHRAKIPHLGSCLSCVDILTAVYWGALQIDPKDPRNPNRDRFILSKGHGAPALFQVLSMKEFYPVSTLDTFGQDGSYLAEHPPTPKNLPGVEAATGSLGHGLPIGVGMAMAAKIQKRDYRVFALLSDGECNEGSIWEAALLAASQKLNRLTVIIDFNKWQATGSSEEIMALNPLVDKWKAFGWDAFETDGHDITALLDLLKTPNDSGKPVAIVAHTVKGKGVSFMEDDNNWHYRTPSEEEVKLARRELLDSQ